MNDVQNFLTTGRYSRADGCIVPLLLFVRQYTAWLGCPHKEMYWAQHRRIERALIDLGHAVGFCSQRLALFGRACKTEGGALFVANLGDGPGAIQLDERTIVLEDSYLMPRDLTPTEADRLRIP